MRHSDGDLVQEWLNRCGSDVQCTKTRAVQAHQTVSKFRAIAIPRDYKIFGHARSSRKQEMIIT